MVNEVPVSPQDDSAFGDRAGRSDFERVLYERMFVDPSFAEEAFNDGLLRRPSTDTP